MRHFTILTLIFLLGGFVHSQIHVGPKLGLAGYQVTNGGFDGLRIGVYAGGFVNYDFNEKRSLLIDLAYVEKGSAENGQSNKFNYLEFSPKIRFFTKVNENKGFNILTGFGFNLLLNDEVDTNDASIIKELRVMDTFDLSLQLGLGYVMPNNLTIDFRLVDVSITSSKNEFRDGNNNILSNTLRNLGSTLTLSYGFDL